MGVLVSALFTPFISLLLNIRFSHKMFAHPPWFYYLYIVSGMAATMSCFVPLSPFFYWVTASRLFTSPLRRVFLRSRIAVQVDIETRVFQGHSQVVTLVDSVHPISRSVGIEIFVLDARIVMLVSSLGSLFGVFCTDFYIGSGHKLEKGDDGGGRHFETQHASQHQAAHIYTCHSVVHTLKCMVY